MSTLQLFCYFYEQRSTLKQGSPKNRTPQMWRLSRMQYKVHSRGMMQTIWILHGTTDISIVYNDETGEDCIMRKVFLGFVLDFGFVYYLLNLEFMLGYIAVVTMTREHCPFCLRDISTMCLA